MKQVTWIQILNDFAEKIKKYCEQQKPPSRTVDLSIQDLKVQLQILRIECDNIYDDGYLRSLFELQKILIEKGVASKK
jgi:hypothetical protein